jgi:D-alanyl-D-alanine carboxypeptidase
LYKIPREETIMRKVIIFCIVLIIQLSIIYGLYKWYVSETASPQPQEKTASQEITQKKAEPKKTTLPIIEDNKENTEKQRAKETTPLQKKNADKKELLAELDKITETKPSPPIASPPPPIKEDPLSKPLIYKYAQWGNIQSLPQSKLAQTGILVDIDTRKVLWAKHCRKSVPIASMTKMMTALLTFEAIKNNPRINFDTEIKVTNEAYSIGGSQVWLDPRESFTIQELLKTVMIKSANDSAYLIAQYLGNGSVKNFVKEMNKRAKEIKMPNAHFSNPEGLPEKYSSDDNRATDEGLVFLAEHLLEYPLALKWAGTKVGWFREDAKQPTMLTNTNHLVRDNFPGITGMKTGYIRRSGYCITATCNRDGKRLVAVVTGFKNRKIRDQFVKKLLDWGYKKDAGLSEAKNN